MDKDELGKASVGSSALVTEEIEMTPEEAADLRLKQDVIKEQFKIKADNRINNLFGKPKVEEVTEEDKEKEVKTFNANEMDLFAIETKNRKTLHNLVLPIYN